MTVGTTEVVSDGGDCGGMHHMKKKKKNGGELQDLRKTSWLLFG
jgi:hypothetical protein